MKLPFANDKIMHFLGGAWIVSVFSPIGWWGILIGTIIMLVLSFVKEKYLDDVFDWKDILAAGIGSVVSILLYLTIFKFVIS